MNKLHVQAIKCFVKFFIIVDSIHLNKLVKKCIQLSQKTLKRRSDFCINNVLQTNPNSTGCGTVHY